MAVTFLSNKKNLSATIHVSAANSGNIIVSGNSTTTNVGGTSTCFAVSNEVLNGAVITQVFWGTDAGSIQILRGSNLVSTFTQSGQVDYAGSGMALTKDKAANVVINFAGSANGYCIIELQKTGTFTSEYLQN